MKRKENTMEAEPQSLENESPQPAESTPAEPSPMETSVSAWIRDNKEMLVMIGTITVTTVKAVAWIITHIDQIRHFFEALGPSKPGKRNDR